MLEIVREFQILLQLLGDFCPPDPLARPPPREPPPL